MNNAFTNYYKDIFSNRNKHRNRASWDILFLNDTRIELDGLDDPFKEEEILRAINDMPNDKAPGPNGFPILIYNKFGMF